MSSHGEGSSAGVSTANETMSTAAAEYGIKTARLMITHMTLENFKSYAGVQTIGPFHKSFSSVVGPNGSGKSNVIDAMLFVFGKRAKDLRQSKVSELIHRSDTFPNLDYATVTVYFQEIFDDESQPEGFRIVSGSETAVSRTAYRNDESRYKIDGKTSNFTEVTTMLRARGIDLDHNRFLILQGEVEQIAMMKPKKDNPSGEGLLEYLEDIIGSNKYVEAIEEAFKRLETLSEARATVLQRVKVVERERESLEAAKTEAEDYLCKELELTQCRSSLFQAFIAEADAANAALNNKAKEIEAVIKTDTAALKVLEKGLTDKENTFNDTNENYNAKKKELADVKKKFDGYEKQDIQLSSDYKNNKANAKKAANDAKTARKNLSEAQAAITSHNAEIERCTAELAEVAAKAATQSAALEALQEECKEEANAVQMRLSSKQVELGPLNARVASAQSEVNVISAEIRMIEEKAAGAAARLADARTAVADNNSLLERKRGELARLQREHATATADLAAATEALNRLTASEAQLKGKVTASRVRTEEARASMSAGKSRSVVVDACLALNARLRGRGRVYGRLGDLGAVDRKYDVAVSTACGNLDHILVDSADTGKACIEHLREHNLGRATFIALDKIQNLEAKLQRMRNSIPSLSSDIVFLLDAITPDEPAFTLAFYMGLSNCFAGEALTPAAKSLAFDGGYRLVTVSGEIIESSGTMSGGGKPVSGRIRMTGEGKSADSAATGGVTLAELKEMEIDLEALDVEYKDTASARRQAEKDVGRFTAAVSAASLAITKCQMDVSSSESQVASLQAAVAELEREASTRSEDTARLTALAGQLRSAEAAVVSAQNAAAGTRAAVAALEDELANVGGGRLKSQKARVAGLSAQSDDLTANLAKANVSLKTAAKAVKKHETAVAEADAAVEDFNAKAEATLESIKAIEGDAAAVAAEFKRLESELEVLSERLSGIKADYDGLKKDAAAARARLVDTTAHLDDLKGEAAENTRKRDHWAAKLKAAIEGFRSLVAEFGVDVASLLKGATGDRLNDQGGDEKDGNGEENDSEEVEPENENANAANKRRGSQRSTSAAPPAKKSKKAGGLLPPLPAVEADLFKTLDAAALEALDRAAVSARIAQLEAALAASSTNMKAIAEYRAKEEEYLSKVSDLDNATAARDKERAAHESLRRARLDEFMAGFLQIKGGVKEMYQMITLGGDAELELVDSLDPFSEGIVFSVRPPKKSWKNISNLSGGEKTLSSLALVFALHHYKPTPLYVMDEIDAALDFKNVSIVANYIKERTRNAQFIIISLRNNMFEVADRLVGIYKTHNCTKSVTINPNKLSIETS